MLKLLEVYIFYWFLFYIGNGVFCLKDREFNSFQLKVFMLVEIKKILKGYKNKGNLGQSK